MKSPSLVLLIIAAICIFANGQAQEKVLWSFGSVPGDGGSPEGGLISDSGGNLYGTTAFGGTGSGGTVFELSPQPGGAWAEAILYNFCSNLVNGLCLDGGAPVGSLVFDSHGSLYGVAGGGTGSSCGAGYSACGVVFELSPPSAPGGVWTESVLYDFCSLANCADGWRPNGGLVFDGSGNLYGTTYGGGNGHQFGHANDGGVAFELSPSESGWAETVLYNFCTKESGRFCPDGAAPEAGVVFGSDGNLYGTTSEGGGKEKTLTVWFTNSRLAATAGRRPCSSANTVPSRMRRSASARPTTSLVQRSPPALSSTPRNRPAVLLCFTPQTGFNSQAGVLIDGVRNALFGTASIGGSGANGGTVWEVTPSRQLVPVYNFCSRPKCADGGDPLGGLIEDQSGNLYGTGYGGGAYGIGVVFEVTPQ